MLNRRFFDVFALFFLSLSFSLHVPLVMAESAAFKLDECLLEQLKKVADNTEIAEIKDLCQKIQATQVSTAQNDINNAAEAAAKDASDKSPDAGTDDDSSSSLFSAVEIPLPTIAKSNGAVSERFNAELKSAFNPYVITPHKMNYILPITYTSQYNTQAYTPNNLELVDSEQKLEAKFQVSFKVPLNYAELLVEGDALFFGMTLNSWWQVYSDEDSKPFRETNYQPELFYYLPVGFKFLNTSSSMAFGIEHQSNGRSLPISRSWNRVYMALIAENDDWAVILKPWFRLPEKDKKSLDDPDGDDNPDIADYMGHFELSGAYRIDQNIQTQFMLRHSFNHSRGAVELGFTYPLWGRLRAYVQYFNGYGESLIDYNHHQQRIGFGIALTDLL